MSRSSSVSVIGMTPVRGILVDEQTRCEHYHGPLDVIALKFACCGDWYPCHRCHAELAGHDAQTWAVADRAMPAVVCGVCGWVLRIDAYLETSACPSCAAEFNPGCRLHHDLYFD